MSKAIVWARLVVQLDAVIVSLKVRAFIFIVFLKMKNVSRVAEGQPACQAGLTGQGPGLTCQARGLAFQAGPRPP